MSENKMNLEIPTLTLPEEKPAAAVAAAAAPIVAEEVKKAAAEPVVIDDSMLTEEERRIVDEFAKKIDITNSGVVLQYGADAQKKISEFSDSALENVRTKDLGHVGDMLTDLIGELREFDASDDSGIGGFFKRLLGKVETMKARYDKAEVNVNKIVATLEDHQVTLYKDIAMLDQMYEKNLGYYKQLTMYIIAGKKRLQEVRDTDLVAAVEKAQKSGLAEDSQAAKDLAEKCDRFEKKLYDLELTRMISIQMSPQIRLVQNNDTLMAEKIQTTIINTIPLWKSQMVLALGLAHSNEAMKAQREVSDMTNELLKKNAETLKMGTIEVAKESERGIVDMETLKATNQSLIDTLDEVLKIQSEGKEARRQAEVELGRLEGELKAKLLEINK